MELLNDTLENFLKIQSEDEKVISQRLSSKGFLQVIAGEVIPGYRDEFSKGRLLVGCLELMKLPQFS